MTASGAGFGGSGETDVLWVSVRAQLDESSFRNMEQQAGEAGDRAGAAGGGALTGRFGALLGTLPGMAAAAAAAVGAALAAGLKSAVDIAAQVNQGQLDMQASLGVTADEARELGEVAKQVFGNNWTGSLAEAQKAVENVRKEVQGLSKQDLQTVTEGSVAIAERFEEDQSKVAAAVQSVMKATGSSAQEALDFISAGFQKGLNSSGDFLDTLNEYGPQFEKAKTTGSELFSLLETGAAKGALGTDKIADSFKEFGFSLADTSKGMTAAFAQLGLDQAELTKKIDAGTMTQTQAYQLVFDKIKGVQSETERMAIISQIFKGAGEDLGKVALNIDTTKTKMAELGGSTETVKNASNTLGAVFQTAWRQVQLQLEPVGQELLKLANDAMPSVKAAINQLGPVVTSVVRFLVDGFRQGRETAQQFAPQINSALDSIKPVVSALGELFRAVFAFIRTYWETILKPAVEAILPVVTTVFSAIASTVKTAVGIVTNVINAVSALLRGDWSKAWQYMAAAVVGGLDGVEKTLKEALPKLGKWGLDLAGKFMAGIKSGLAGLNAMFYNAMAQAMNELGDRIGGMAGDLMKKLAGAAQQAAGAAGAYNGGPVSGITSPSVLNPLSGSNNPIIAAAFGKTGDHMADSVARWCARWVKLTLEKAEPNAKSQIDRFFAGNADDVKNRALSAGKLRKDLNSIEPGDVVLYDKNHIGIYIGNGMVRGNNDWGHKNGREVVSTEKMTSLGSIAGYVKLSEVVKAQQLTPVTSQPKTNTEKTTPPKPTIPLPSAAEQEKYTFSLKDWNKNAAKALELTREWAKADAAHNTVWRQQVEERMAAWAGENKARQGSLSFAKQVISDEKARQDAAKAATKEAEQQQDQAAKDAVAAAKARQAALDNVAREVAAGRVKEAQRSLDEAKRHQADEVNVTGLTAEQKVSIYQATTNKILKSAYALHAEEKRQADAAVDAWAKSEEAKALTTKERDAEVARRKAANRTTEKNANVDAQREQATLLKQASDTQIAEGQRAADAAREQAQKVADARYKMSADLVRYSYGQGDEGLVSALASITGFSVEQVSADVDKAIAEAERLNNGLANAVKTAYASELEDRKQEAATLARINESDKQTSAERIQLIHDQALAAEEATGSYEDTMTMLRGILTEAMGQGIDPRQSGYVGLLDEYIAKGGEAAAAAQYLKDNLDQLLMDGGASDLATIAARGRKALADQIAQNNAPVADDGGVTLEQSTANEKAGQLLSDVFQGSAVEQLQAAIAASFSGAFDDIGTEGRETFWARFGELADSSEFQAAVNEMDGTALADIITALGDNPGWADLKGKLQKRFADLLAVPAGDPGELEKLLDGVSKAWGEAQGRFDAGASSAEDLNKALDTQATTLLGVLTNLTAMGQGDSEAAASVRLLLGAVQGSRKPVEDLGNALGTLADQKAADVTKSAMQMVQGFTDGSLSAADFRDQALQLLPTLEKLALAAEAAGRGDLAAHYREMAAELHNLGGAALAAAEKSAKAAATINKIGDYAQKLVPVVTGAMQMLGGATSEEADQWGADLSSMVSDLTNFGMAVAKGDWVGATIQALTSIFGWFSRNKKAAEEAAKATKAYNEQFMFSTNGYGTRTTSKYTTGILFWSTDHYKEQVDTIKRDIALALEGGFQNGIKSGFEAALAANDFSAFGKSLKESVGKAVLDGLITAFMNEAVMKETIGPAIQQYLKDGNTAALQGAVTAATAQAETFYNNVLAPVAAQFDLLGNGGSSSTSNNGSLFGNAPTVQLGIPHIEVSLPPDALKPLSDLAAITPVWESVARKLDAYFGGTGQGATPSALQITLPDVALKPLTDFGASVLVFDQASRRLLTVADKMEAALNGNGNPPALSGNGGLT